MPISMVPKRHWEVSLAVFIGHALLDMCFRFRQMVAVIELHCALLQELLQQNVDAAESALRHFQSCVRTTLLLSNGYECQEKVCICFLSMLAIMIWTLRH